jgi:fructosamine-3-kinase
MAQGRRYLFKADRLREQVQTLLKQELGSTTELVAYQVARRHHDYVVLLAKLRHPSRQVVLKLAGPEAPLACPFERTAPLHRLVAAHTTIPMPNVIAVDTSYQKWPWRYLIKTHCPGQEWASARRQMSAEQLSAAYRQIGQAVAQLHAIRFPGFGELTVEGQVHPGLSCEAALQERAKVSIKDTRLCERFLAVLERYAHLFVDISGASLCHEDLHSHNILFEHSQGGWRLATILDFDKAWAGHRETDLARLELWRGMTSEEFWQAYGATHPSDTLYRQRRPIYQLLWCLEYARPTAAHLADTRRVCEELGIPPVERFA